jgi:4-hydroxybenzoate polyprenyltransferase
MDDAARLPDAASANWVDRFAPPWLRPWLKLGRFDRPAPIWLLILPGWQGIALADAMLGRWPNPRLLFLFLLGSALMRGAGCAYNDIIDRDIDVRVARTAARPVASGRIGIRAAWIFLVVLSLLGLGILLTLNVFSVFLGVLSLGLVAAYPYMKRITWWPQAWLGLTFNWGALLGYAAALPLPTLFSPGAPGQVPVYVAPPLLLYASGVAWTLGYDTIYAVQDLEDDALVGVKSSARRLGAAAPKAVLIFYLIAIALALAAGAFARLGWPFWVLAPLFAVSLVVQPRQLRLDDPARALTLFKSNTISGALLFLAIAAGTWR